MISVQSNRLDKQSICRTAGKRVVEKRFEEAFDLFSQAVCLAPNDYRLYLNRSYCAQQLNRLPEALKDADSALAINEANIAGHYRKGCVLLCLNQFRSAEQSFERALSFDANDVNAKSKLNETKRLFLKEFGFADKHIDRLLEEYKTCSHITDALIDGELIRKLDHCHIGSESVSMASIESPRVEPSLQSISFRDNSRSDNQRMTSEDISLAALASNWSLIGENEAPIRSPKTNPFAKTTSPAVAAIGAQRLSDSALSMSSNESLPTIKCQFVKTRPQIRIKPID